MQEKVFLIMSKNGCQVAEHEITDINHKELLDLVAIQREYGRECSVKRVFIPDNQGKGKTVGKNMRVLMLNSTRPDSSGCPGL